MAELGYGGFLQQHGVAFFILLCLHPSQTTGRRLDEWIDMCAVVWQLWKNVATRNYVPGPLSEYHKLKLMQCHIKIQKHDRNSIR